jgi:outer membrane protein OmpA-like peptidoglycan-associated protein
MKKACLTLFIFHFSLFICPALTTAEEMENLLANNAVTYAAAARFILQASDRFVTSDPNAAFRYAAERNWLPKDAKANDVAQMDGVALLMMRSFDIKGGVMYTITKSPHYAYRELIYKNIIQGKADPAMNVPGERLIFATSRVFTMKDDEAELAAAQELRTEIAKRQRAAKDAGARREILAREINAILQRNNFTGVKAEVTGQGVSIQLSDILFMPDSTVLVESEKAKLREISNILKALPGRRVQVAGHTAMAGTAERRLAFSKARAQAVASYLVSLGARRRSAIKVIGYGGERPVANNSTAAGMAANRRVEIIILEN